MKKSFSLPPVSIRKKSQPEMSNSFDMIKLDSSVPKNSISQNYFVDLAKLSARTDYLKQENEILKEELYDIITSSEQTEFHRIKRNIIALSAKLSKHEKESDDVMKAISTARKANKPTPLNIYLPNFKDLAEIDYILDSFLLENPQKNFFPANEIEMQNKEIKKAIKMATEKLNKSKKTLSLYEDLQTKNAVPLTIESLKKGENPLSHVDAAPSEIKEQREKIKQLKAELKKLVQKRKEQEEKEENKDNDNEATPTAPKQPDTARRSPRRVKKVKISTKTQETNE